MYPVFVQVLLALAMYVLLGVARARALRSMDRPRRGPDLAMGKGAWPEDAAKRANNQRNQFELPVLFYAVAAFALGGRGWPWVGWMCIGGAALILMRASEARRRKLQPLARIVAVSTHAQAPAWFTTAPIGAIKKVLVETGWKAGDVGLFEINEAFAVVTMAAMRDLALPHDKVNVHGGACALGHPVGASGARIIVTLLSALEKYGQTRGVAALCIGGGEATAVAVERLAA